MEEPADSVRERCARCQLARGAAPATERGTIVRFHRECPRAAEFHQAVVVAHRGNLNATRDTAAQLGIPAGKYYAEQPADDVWWALLKIIAEKDKVSELINLMARDAEVLVEPLRRLWTEVPCRFTQSVAPANLGDSTYLKCDRDDEWQPLDLHRDKSDPCGMLFLGPQREALDCFYTRIRKFLDGVTVCELGWEPDYGLEQMRAELVEAIRSELLHRSIKLSAQATPQEALATVPGGRFVLLHPILRIDSPWDAQQIEAYYDAFSLDVKQLLENDKDFRAPVVVQALTWEAFGSRSRAKKLAVSIGNKLKSIAPDAPLIEHQLRPIGNKAVLKFLKASGGDGLWPHVRRDIHHLPWPPLFRKSSEAVYNALKKRMNGQSNGAPPSKRTDQK